QRELHRRINDSDEVSHRDVGLLESIPGTRKVLNADCIRRTRSNPAVRGRVDYVKVRSRLAVNTNPEGILLHNLHQSTMLSGHELGDELREQIAVLLHLVGNSMATLVVFRDTEREVTSRQ